MRHNPLIFSFTFALVLHGTRAESEQSYLSPEVVRALKDAQKSGGYVVRVLSKGPRSVVVLGEEHWKGKTDHQIGENVLQHFPLRGLEGVASENRLWADRLIFGPLRHVANSRRRGRGEETYGSTIQSAGLNDVEYLLKSQPKHILKLLAAEIERLSAADRDKFEVSLAVGKKKMVLTGSEVLKILGRTDEKAEKRKTTSPKIKTFWLEQGHKYNFAEQLLSLYVPVVEVGTWGLAKKLGEITGLEKTSLGFITNPTSFAFGKWRDRTFAKNIDAALREQPNPSSMLVVVGRGHIPGMIEQLTKKFGYEQIPLATK